MRPTEPRVLIADDQPDVLEALRLLLKAESFQLESASSPAAVLAANQGLYNGFLAAGLAWGLLHSAPAFAFQIKVFFLLCVIIAGVYGAAATVSRRILYVQAAPAAIALILLSLA